MKSIGSYPNIRLRRNRKSDWSRRLIRENELSVNDLIWPIFIREGKNIKEPIESMPGVYRYTLDKVEKLVEKVKEIKNKKIKIDDKFIKEILTVNGVRFILEDSSWGLIRASSNKPSLVVGVESTTSDQSKKRIFHFIDNLLKETGKIGEYDQKI